MGLIGRRCTAVMPSRPVLIGRGLVIQALNKTNNIKCEQHENRSAARVHTTTTKTSTTPHTPRVHPGAVAGEWLTQSYGGHSEGETPGPIPNPEVKPFSADGTATERLWESRTPPDILVRRGHLPVAPTLYFGPRRS